MISALDTAQSKVGLNGFCPIIPLLPSFVLLSVPETLFLIHYSKHLFSQKPPKLNHLQSRIFNTFWQHSEVNPNADLTPDAMLFDDLKTECQNVLVAQLCVTLCDSKDGSPPGSSVHEILQARVLRWVAISFSRESFWPRDPTQVSCIAGRFILPSDPQE